MIFVDEFSLACEGVYWYIFIGGCGCVRVYIYWWVRVCVDIYLLAGRVCMGIHLLVGEGVYGYIFIGG